MKFYIIAGEASGDMHAANLMKQIKLLDKDAEFRCWGGDNMQEAGAEIVKHYKNLAFMGFWEVITNLRTILRNIQFCKKDIVAWQPDAVILVDYPGFNLRIAKFVKQAGFKTFYYISPQVWAWKASRVEIIKKYVDRMLVILPFEKDFYKKWDYEVDYVGHPLLDVVENHEKKADFVEKNNLGKKPIVALLPGSRKQEITKVLPIMLQLQEANPQYQFVIAGAAAIEASFYEKILGDQKIPVVKNITYDLLQHAEAAVVTSGTATLETALFNVPEIVCYKGSWFSFLIGKFLVDVKYISLVNLVMDKLVVQEFIQKNCIFVEVNAGLNQVLHNSVEKERMLRAFKELREKLGGAGASEKAAGIIVKRTRSLDTIHKNFD